MNRKAMRWMSIVLLLSEVAFFTYAVANVYFKGSLPPPFYYDTNDTYMDLYNTLYWSWNDGRYDNWRSIYPLFVFLIGQIVSDTSCAATVVSPFGFRSCDTSAVLALFLTYVIGGVAAAVAVVRGARINLRKGTGIVYLGAWIVIVLLSVSGLFALERGNTIVLLFLVLSVVSLCGFKWPSAIAFGLGVCIKPYVIALLFVPVLNRKYVFTCAVFATVLAVNTISFMLVPDVHWPMLFENITSFASMSAISVMDRLWFPTSLSAYTRVLDSRYALLFNDQFLIQSVFVFFSFLLWIGRAVFLFGLLCLLKLNKKIEPNLLYAYILVGLLVSTDSIGGYGILLLLPFLGNLIGVMEGKLLSISLIALLIPLEIPSWPSKNCDGVYIFLTDSICTGVASVSLWSYVRPSVLLLLLLQLVVFFCFMLKKEGLYEKVSPCS